MMKKFALLAALSMILVVPGRQVDAVLRRLQRRQGKRASAYRRQAEGVSVIQ